MKAAVVVCGIGLALCGGLVPAVAEAALLGDAFLISSAPGVQTWSDAAFDSTSGRFLAVWSDRRNILVSGYDVYGQLVNPDGTPFGPEILIAASPGDEKRPAVRYSPTSNRFLVVWPDTRNQATTLIDMYGQIIGADGTLVGSNFPVSTARGDQFRPAMAYDPVNDRFVATWQDGRAGRLDVFAQIINPDGTLVGGNVGISTVVGSNEERPKVVYDSTRQRFLFVWDDQRNAAVSGGDIYGQFTGLDLTLIGSAFPISTAPGDQFRPAVGYDPDDDVYLVAYIDCRNNLDICREGRDPGTDMYARIVGGDGTMAGDEIAVTTDPAPQYRPAIGYSPVDRLFLLTWTDERNMGTAAGVDTYRAIVNPDGTLLGAVGPATLAASDQHRSAVTYDSLTNRMLVVFSSKPAPGAFDLMGQFVSLSRLVGAEFIVSAAFGQEDVPTVAYSSASDSFLAAWVDSRTKAVTNLDLYMQVIDGDGSLLGGNLVLSDAANVQKIPTIGYSALGNHYLTAWSDRRHTTQFDNNLLGRLVNPDGTFKSDEFTISDARGDQGGPVIAGNAAGDLFLIVWADNRSRTANGFDIYGQLLAGDGTLIGSNFRITYDATDQFRPSIAYSETQGLFMVTWTDCRHTPDTCTRATETGAMVYAQLIDTAGAFVGGAFAVTDVVGDHSQSNVAYNTVDDRFVVVWEDGRNIAVSSRDIYGQVLGGDGSLIGGNFPIATAPEQQARPVIAHSPVDNQFLVVWADDRNILTTSKDLYGQALSGTGGLLGVNFPIAIAPVGQNRPTVAHNPVTNQFLVIWVDTRFTKAADVYGRLVTLAP